MATSDSIAPLTRSARHVTVGALHVVVPYVPASVWMEALQGDERVAVVALCEDRATLTRALLSGHLNAKQIEAASHELIELESGVRWWTALKLVRTSYTKQVLGELTLCGVDPGLVSFGQWCAATYRVLTRHADAKQTMKTDFELELPPMGMGEAWDDGNDWDALLSQQTG